MSSSIPFNKPHSSDLELRYLKAALAQGHLSGDGPFTKSCHEWLRKFYSSQLALLTHSCTAALEMAALLLRLEPGDEVIMPSYTFVSTANAVVLRGARPVFIDIRPDTLNMDEEAIEAAITNRTKSIWVVHYAGVGCEMDSILAQAKAANLVVVEDAAQACGAKYRGKHLGTLGALSCLSFHETKNIVSGEGGALLVNQAEYAERAEIIREKGTNRSRFFRGQVDKYTWVDIGSSFLPSDLVAAHLFAQFEQLETIQSSRMKIWQAYHEAFADLEKRELLKRPFVPEQCEHNAHMYYLVCKDLQERTALIEHLAKLNIKSVFHYVPLHSSPAGQKYSRFVGDMKVTNRIAETQLRLPLWPGLTEVARVIDGVNSFYRS